MSQKTTPEFTLYHYWRSSCSWRLRWAMAIKGLNYKSVTIDLVSNEQRSKSYLKINPAGSVPTLSYGNLHLSESLATIEWLDERFPTPPLLPQQPDRKFVARRIAHYIATAIQPIQNLKVLRHVAKHSLDQNEWARSWNQQGLETLETLLQQSSGTFAVGGELSIADICLVPQCYNAKRFGVHLESYPTINRVFLNCMDLPTCIAAAPENQPGANQT